MLLGTSIVLDWPLDWSKSERLGGCGAKLPERKHQHLGEVPGGARAVVIRTAWPLRNAPREKRLRTRSATCLCVRTATRRAD